MSFALSYKVEMFLQDRKRLAKIGAALLVAILACVVLLWNAARLRPPPSIFDTPIDNTLSYLTMKDFS
jgi:multisubunit Na+/H+ antiporter MnhB subunit